MQTADPLGQISAFIQDLASQVAVADGRARQGQPIDLAGFDARLGLLCAQVLDLPPDQGRSIRAALAGLRDGIEQLTATLISPAVAGRRDD